MKNLKGLIFSALVLGICLFVNPDNVFATSCTGSNNDNAKYSISVDGGTNYCQTINDAFNEVSTNGTIQLLQADEFTELVKVEKNVTLDLNGKVLTVNRNGAGFQITNASVNLTIKDSGTNGTIVNNSNAVVLLAAGHLDLNGGTLESNSAAATIQIGHSSANYTGSMTMNGGTVRNKSNNAGFAINIVRGDLEVNDGTIQFDGKSTAILVGDNDATKGTLTFNGGTVESKSVGVMIDNGSAKITNGIIKATESGYSAVQLGSSTSSEDVSLEVTGGRIENNNSVSGNAILIAKSTATIKGGTIVSNNGSAAIQVGENTMKHESHLVMTGGTVENKTSAPAILVTYANTDANISGGTIKINEELITNEKHNDVAISIGLDSEEGGTPGAKVTITDADITGGIGLFGKNPELDFKGGSVKAKSFAVSGNGAQTQDSKITISGGSLTSENSAAIYHPQTGSLNITNGNISGKIGVVARQGDVVVSGGTITATGTEDEKIRVGDSKEGDVYVQLPTGVAIIVDNSNEKGYSDDANVKVTNGTINGDVDSLLSYGKSNAKEKEFVVSGGSFNNHVKTEYLISNVQQSENGVVGKVHKITTTKSKNGTVKLPSNAAEGETVTVKYTANKGFALDSIIVKKADGTKVKVVGGKFVMPAGDVTVTVTFKEETNPATGDNLLTYVSLGAIALIGTLGTSLYLKKVNK